MEDVKTGVIEYAPKAYEFLQAQVKKLNIAGNEKIAHEIVKLLSLTPESLAFKMQGMCQCMVNQGQLKTSEAGMISDVYASYAKNDLIGIGKALDTLVAGNSNSAGMKAIIGSLASVGGVGYAATAQAAGNNWDNADKIGAAIGTLTGFIAGFLIGGFPGAVAGAKIGEMLGKAIGSLFKAIFGKKKKDNVVAGPNGEDCTPPFLPMW